MQEQFPPFQHILDSLKSGTSVSVNREALLDGLRASLAADINIELAFSEGKPIHIKASSAEKGDADAIVEGAVVTGKPISIRLFGSYLVDQLAACQDELVTLKLDDDLAPIQVLGSGAFGVVMPVRK